jgi:hypothetical protein
MYNIYKASVSPGSVQQIMPYWAHSAASQCHSHYDFEGPMNSSGHFANWRITSASLIGSARTTQKTVSVVASAWGGEMFSVRCIATSKIWTYREHCFYCYVTYTSSPPRQSIGPPTAAQQRDINTRHTVAWAYHGVSMVCMAMLVYCWQALKLEGVHWAVAQSCVEQIRHDIDLTLNGVKYSVGFWCEKISRSIFL